MQNKNIIQILRGTIIWLVVFLVVGGIGSWFLLGKFEQKESDLEMAKDEYLIATSQIRSFDTIKKNFESSLEYREELKRTMVDPENTLDLIEELEAAAENTGVALQTSIGEEPGTPSVLSKISQFPKGLASNPDKNKKDTKKSNNVWLLLEAEGNFAQILKFILYLENSRKFISVENFKLEQAQKLTAEEIFQGDNKLLGKLKAEIIIKGFNN